MLRSMYAGISGMKGFQDKLDVIGNNIANVNTTGFKKGRVTFQDMLSQTTTGASGPTGNRGGVNPSQVGLGSQVGTIDDLHTQGSSQTTGKPLDLQLEGDGMFAVEKPDGTKAYTRAGNFYLDAGNSDTENAQAGNEGGEANIVNADGYYLMGKDQDGDSTHLSIPKEATNINIEQDGTVTYVESNTEGTVEGDGENATNNNSINKDQQIQIAQFSNPAGLKKSGGSLYEQTPNSGDANMVDPEGNGAASIVSGALEMSNVDLSDEFTDMITAQRGFQANTRIITTSDEILQELVNLKR